MSTNISRRQTGTFVPESRGWLRGPHGTGPGDNPSIMLDFTLIDAAVRPNGFAPSGLVLGKVNGTPNVYGQYDPAAVDGRQTAAGLLLSSVRTPANTATKIGGALYVHGFVDDTRLPVKTGTKGILDAAARTALKLILFG